MKKYRNVPLKFLALTLIVATMTKALANDAPFFMQWVDRLDDIKITDTNYEKTLTNIKKKSSALSKAGNKRGAILFGLQAAITEIINEFVASYLKTKASGKKIQKTDTDHKDIRIPTGTTPQATRSLLAKRPKLITLLYRTLSAENLKFIGEPFSEIPGEENAVWIKAEFIEKLNNFIDIVRLAGLIVPKESDWFFVKEEAVPSTQEEMVDKSQELFREKAAYYEYLMKELRKTLAELSAKKDPNRYYLAQFVYYITVMQHIDESKNKILQTSRSSKEARIDAKKAILDAGYDTQEKIKLAGPLKDILADSYQEFLAVVKNWPAEADSPPVPQFPTAWEIERPAKVVATALHLENLSYPLEELSALGA